MQSIVELRSYPLVVSLTPLREYQNNYQGYSDCLNNTAFEPTEIEKNNTLLAGVDSVRYQVAIFNFGLQPTNPTCNDVKTQLLYLDQLNRSHSTSHPAMSTVTSSINKLSVDTPAQAISPTTVHNDNPCARYGQMKSTHPEGCPQFEKVVCTVYERQNHAALFC